MIKLVLRQSFNPTLQKLAALDARLFLGINQAHQRFNLRSAVRLVSASGDGYLYALLAFILILVDRQAGSTLLLVGCAAFLVELPLYWVLKNTCKRRRPFHVVAAMAPFLKPSDEFSFPSGHTTAAFVFATAASHFFPVLTLVLFSWAALIGLSRVMLRVHFVSDVLAGMLLGTLIANLSLFWLSQGL